MTYCNIGVPLPKFVIPPVKDSGNYFGQFMSTMCAEDLQITPNTLWFAAIVPHSKNLASLIDNYTKEYFPHQWNVSRNLKKVSSEERLDHSVLGCIFAQSVEIPDEHISCNYSSDASNLEGTFTTAQGYTSNDLRMDFLETDYSITDSFLVPWIRVVKQKGLFARSANDSVKSTIYVKQLKRSKDSGALINKTYTFYNAVPVSAGENSLTYTPEADILRTTQFVFTDKSISYD